MIGDMPRSLGSLGLLASLPLVLSPLLWASAAFAQAPAAAAPPPAAPAPPTGTPSGGAANCPPGSWFCADAAGNTGPQGSAGAATPAPAASGGLQPLPPPPPVTSPQGSGGSVAAPPPYGYKERSAPPVVAYVPPLYPYPYREWGLNLHLQGAFIGARRDVGAGMGGLGVALRNKHNPYFGGELSLDFYGGRDYNGDARGEAALGYNALFFVNPRSSTQLYFLAGLGFATARVQRTGYYTYEQPVAGATGFYATETYKYTYFGGQLGTGVEFRTSRHIAFNVDLRFFMRGRIDGNTRVPEYVSSDGRGTNTSGGALLTAGMTIYF